jgi:hypothetical protein
MMSSSGKRLRWRLCGAELRVPGHARQLLERLLVVLARAAPLAVDAVGVEQPPRVAAVDLVEAAGGDLGDLDILHGEGADEAEEVEDVRPLLLLAQDDAVGLQLLDLVLGPGYQRLVPRGSPPQRPLRLDLPDLGQREAALGDRSVQVHAQALARAPALALIVVALVLALVDLDLHLVEAALLIHLHCGGTDSTSITTSPHYSGTASPPAPTTVVGAGASVVVVEAAVVLPPSVSPPAMVRPVFFWAMGWR